MCAECFLLLCLFNTKPKVIVRESEQYPFLREKDQLFIFELTKIIYICGIQHAVLKYAYMLERLNQICEYLTPPP